MVQRTARAWCRLLAVPFPYQNGREPGVIDGHARGTRMPSELVPPEYSSGTGFFRAALTFSALEMTGSLWFPRERLHQGWWGNLPGRMPARSPTHPEGGQKKGTDEHDDADDQQVKQAMRDDARDAQCDPPDQQ
jgi:hypothetical protein